jgi:hypothetical protein
LLLVFGAAVIDAVANRTLKMDDFAHVKFFFTACRLKPPTGIEPVASSLPRTCSTG